MKKIKIFIGSSVDKKEFELEREKLGSFINGLNRQYINRGIFIDLYDCETVSNAMRPEGSQQQHDSYIENEADATFFMFFKKAGEFTLHELRLARDTLVRLGRPDIFTYFKVVNSDIEQTEDIKKAVDLIAKSYGHYFSKFSDVDTVKLGMLQYLTEKLNDGSKLSIVNGKFYLGSTEVDSLSAENVFAYQNNAEIKKLQNEISELEIKTENALKDKLWHELAVYTSALEEKGKQLNSLQNDILRLLLEMQKELKGGDVNPLRAKAYSLIEMGKIKEAQALFPIDVLKGEAENLLLKKEITKNEQAEFIQNAKVRINALKLDITNENRFALIEETFDFAEEIAFIAQEDSFLLSFINFLETQNKLIKAYNIAKRLEALYALFPLIADGKKKYRFFNLLGMICCRLQIMADEAEKYFINAAEIIKELSLDSPELCAPLLSDIYNNLGLFYCEQENEEKAEEFYLKSIALTEMLAEKEPEKYSGDLALCYNNLASLYRLDPQKDEKTKDYYIKALEIRKKLAEENPKFLPVLGDSLNDIANFYSDIREYQKAEEHYTEAIKIRTELMEKNPERYKGDLAMTYNNIALLFSSTKQSQKAEEYFLRAIKIYEEPAEDQSEIYSDNLALACKNLALLYDNTENFEDAEKYYSRALKIYKTLAEKNPDKYNWTLAECYLDMGIFYDEFEELEQAAECYAEAIKIFESPIKIKPEDFEPDYALALYYSGLIKEDNAMCLKAYEIAKKYPKDRTCKYIIEETEG